MKVKARHNSSKVEEPRPEALYLPAAFVAAQHATVLRYGPDSIRLVLPAGAAHMTRYL
jgi:hypothetical protein